MTRNQRKRIARERKAAKARAQIVQANMSRPVTREPAPRISGVYAGHAMDRARGFGVVPGHLRPGKRDWKLVSRVACATPASGLSDAANWYGHDNPEHRPMSRKTIARLPRTVRDKDA